jgi:hypothetical protein
MSLLNVFLLSTPAHAMHKALITAVGTVSQTAHVPITRINTMQQHTLFRWHLLGKSDTYRVEDMHPVRKEAFLACTNVAPLIKRYIVTHRIEDLQKVADAYSTCLHTLKIKFPAEDLLYVVKVSDRERVLEILDVLQRDASTCSELLQSKTKPAPGGEPFTPWQNLFSLADIEYEPEKEEK